MLLVVVFFLFACLVCLSIAVCFYLYCYLLGWLLLVRMVLIAFVVVICELLYLVWFQWVGCCLWVWLLFNCYCFGLRCLSG